MSRPGPPKTFTKLQRSRKDRLDRLDRLTKLKDKIGMLNALMAEYEQRGRPSDIQEARQIKRRLRTYEQQVRYIGVSLRASSNNNNKEGQNR